MAVRTERLSMTSSLSIQTETLPQAHVSQRPGTGPIDTNETEYETESACIRPPPPDACGHAHPGRRSLILRRANRLQWKERYDFNPHYYSAILPGKRLLVTFLNFVFLSVFVVVYAYASDCSGML